MQGHSTDFECWFGFFLSKRPTSYSQPEVLEDLNIEYEKLFANAKVLNLVEDYFNDTFDAKCFLSDIFMVSAI